MQAINVPPPSRDPILRIESGVAGTADVLLNREGIVWLRDRLDKILGDRRPPEAREPSLDLKEAISVALRSYLTLYPSLSTEAASDLDEVFGEDGGQAQAELDRLADHLAEAVATSPTPLSVDEIAALRGCAACARTLAGGMVETEKERVLNLSEVAVAAVDRLSGARENDDPFDARRAEGEETGVAAFDPHDPERLTDAIIDLGARLTALESQMAELRDAEVVDVFDAAGRARTVVGRLDRTWQTLGKHIRALELSHQGHSGPRT